MAEPRPVVLATGGTGGHVFPAEALAGELEARGVPFTLVTDSRGRQWQGALSHRPIHYIHSASPSGSLGQRLKAMLSLGLGLFDAWRALGRIGPSAVVGFGGYASVPTMVAARLRRLPAMLHEQNAVLGRANRLVLGGVARIATSFDQHPLHRRRRSAARSWSAIRCASRCATLRDLPYRAPGEGRVIDLVVFGGSQGAASFSQVVPEAILSLPPALRSRIRLVQQCRPEDFDKRAPALCARRRRRRAGAVLRRPAAAAGGGASGDRPRRRLDRGRACDHRPAVDPGALSLRRRRPPDRQCPRLRGGGRLHRDARTPSSPRAALAGASDGAVRASRSVSPTWPPPPMPPAGPMPPPASPTWSAR